MSKESIKGIINSNFENNLNVYRKIGIHYHSIPIVTNPNFHHYIEIILEVK